MNFTPTFRKYLRCASQGFVAAFFLCLLAVPMQGQLLFDSFADGNFTASPIWGGSTSDWTITANSDAAAGATGSNTLRLNVASGSGTKYLSSQIGTWGTSQEWGFWAGRRAQAFTGANQMYIWLYANESNLFSLTVDGYRLAIGDDTGGDEIRLEYIVNGAVSATVLSSSGSITNGITDMGFLVRVTRSAAGSWTLYTSALPTSTGTGAIATDIPNSTNASVNQGNATHNTLVPAANGYLGVGALHSSGTDGRAAVEFDQVYFTTQVDYTISTASNAITITDVSGNAETLTVSENSTNIRFNVPGRTYSLNGGIATSFPADVPLAGVTSITINTATGDDVVNIGAFTANLPSLTVNGGVDNDAVNFNGDITFAANANLDLDLQNDNASPGIDQVTVASNANLLLSGTGAATLKLSRSLTANLGGSIETVNGNLLVECNQQATPTSDNFIGVDLNGGVLKTSGTGVLSVKGKGGNNSAGLQHGIYLHTTGKINGGTTGTVTVVGAGGAATGVDNYGIWVEGSNSTINSTGANLDVTGTGGGVNASRFNHGIYLSGGGTIQSGGSGTVEVDATAGYGAAEYIYGLYVVGSTTAITSAGGNVHAAGYGGGSAGIARKTGVYLTSSGMISAGGSGTVLVEGIGGVSTGNGNNGVEVNGGTITSSGGNVTVTGLADGSGTSNNNYGVLAGGLISAGGSGTVTVEGAGATSTTGGSNTGVRFGGGLNISSSGGNVSVTGYGGGSGASASNYGIQGLSSGMISAGGSGTLTVTGTGGPGTGIENYGIYLVSSSLSSSGGNVSVTGIGGGSTTAYGIYTQFSGDITTATNGGDITLVANSANIGAAVSTMPAGSITVLPYTNGVGIDLGSGADPNAGPLGLSDTELDNFSTGTLWIGDANTGDITVSANITRSTATDMVLSCNGDVLISGGQINTGGGALLLDPGASPAAVKPTQTGTDVTASTLSFGSDLAIVINGTSVDNQYTQLNVSGDVDLSGVDLVLSGTHTPAFNDNFIIVNNAGANPVTGTFTGLAEGATISNFLGSALDATISYIGGDGNDVVLSIPDPCSAVTISFTATPTNTGSCNNSGQIAVSGVSGGAGPYMYSKDNGASYQASATFTGLAANTYQVVVKDANGCTSAATPVLVGTNPAPSCSVTGFDYVCPQSTGNVYSAPGGMASYAWSISGAGTIVGSTTGSSVTVTAGGYTLTYTVSVTVTDASGCTSVCSKETYIFLLPLAPATITPSANPVCFGVSINLSTPAASSSTLSWTGSGVVSPTGNPSTMVLPPSPGSHVYAVTVTTDYGCTSTGSVTIIVNPLPTATCPSYTPVCVSTAAFALAGGSPAGGIYSGPGVSSGMFNPATAGPGMHTITYTYEDGNGCEGTCTFTITVLASCNLSFSGQILFSNNNSLGVKDANVVLAGSASGSNLSDINGNYAINTTVASGNFTLTPSKTINKLNGVTAADATAIQQHVATTVPITDMYKLVAADVNKTNSVNTLDASIITQALLGNATALAQFKTSWRFVPTSHTMTNPPWGFPEQRSYTGISSNQSNQNFYGIKTGDVASVFANPANFGPAGGLELRTADRVLQAGSELVVEFSAGQLADLAAFQLAFLADPEQLQLLTIEPLTALPLTTDHFGTYNIAAGELRLVWTQAKGMALPEAAPVFRLRFATLQSGAKLSEVLRLDETPMPALSYTTALAESAVSLVFTEATGTGTAGAATGLQLFQNQPNPFRGATRIGFVLPQSGTAQLRIFDASGRLLAEREGQYAAGRHEERFDNLSAGAGVGYYELVTPFGVLTRKMVVLGE